MLDYNVEKGVAQFESSVSDTIWLGKMNQGMRRCKMNGHNDLMTWTMVRLLEIWQQDPHILDLYRRLKDHSKIRWKDSIKKVVGLNG